MHYVFVHGRGKRAKTVDGCSHAETWKRNVVEVAGKRVGHEQDEEEEEMYIFHGKRRPHAAAQEKFPQI